MNMSKKAYIAGKITGDKDYRKKFEAVALFLENKGYVVLNPAVLPEGMSRADYMRICVAMIDSADMVGFMSGWTESDGARLEREYCSYIEKPVVDLNMPGGCKWCMDEICVNADCPLCADYCPVPNDPEVCRYEDRKQEGDNAQERCD